MKILLVHNNYGVYSGEEAVVDRQSALFEEMGHQVSVYRKTTEGKRETLSGQFKAFFTGFYSPGSIGDIKKIIQENRPDAVIVHNLYPYISPAILKHFKKAGIPVIMTLHNFRLICPTGLFMRNAIPCERCLEKGNEWGCIRYNCEHSRLKSIGYAGRNWFARITKAYKNNVDYFACITKFQIQKLSEAGFDSKKTRHIPNFLETDYHERDSKSKYVAFAGRLSKEKGIDLILQVAKETPEIQYQFAGSVRPEDKEMVENAPENCSFLGHLNKEQLNQFYRNARFLLMTSRWYEGFPMTILEAASHQKPAIGPGYAGFFEIIDPGETGLLFSPGKASDLKEKLTTLWENPEQAARMGEAAYQKLREQYSTQAVKTKWSELFSQL